MTKAPTEIAKVFIHQTPPGGRYLGHYNLIPIYLVDSILEELPMPRKFDPMIDVHMTLDGEVVLENLPKKGAVPDYKEASRQLAIRFAESEASALTQKNGLRDANINLDARSKILLRIKAHWSYFLLPATIKNDIAHQYLD